MGTLRRTTLVACALALAPLGDAWAGGDLFRFPPEPVVSVPQPIAIPEFSVWYLRGDVAYGFSREPDLSQGGIVLTNPDMDDTWGLGGGFGYFFNDNVRGDVTLDYRFDADVTGVHPATGATHKTGISSTVGLANIYYDFRGREALTPYVGAGVGFAYNETDDQEITTGGVTTSIGGNGETGLAAALMAGLSYRMSSNWTFDAGYRFLYLGDTSTDGDGTTDELRIDDIESHEIRFGIRYEFQ